MSSWSDVLEGLTPEQARAAALTGPVLALAGAGTGKTKTLTAGVAHRIRARGIAPSRILAVTFTNKAAGEMCGRIRALLGEEATPRWIGTFHGLGARQLRSGREVAGLRPGFDILDADDSQRVLKAMNLAAGDEAETLGRAPLKLLCNRLSAFKDDLVLPAEAPAYVEAKNRGSRPGADAARSPPSQARGSCLRRLSTAAARRERRRLRRLAALAGPLDAGEP
jgi:DNA helicase-2/ATP-dependent DNA helicase PcrA